MKASIIIRAYNVEKTIKRALESALNQNFPKEEYEIVVINDGSMDRTRDVLRGYESEKNLRIFDQENKGAVRAANVGAKASLGKYLTYLDGDDEFLPTLLKESVPVLEKNGSAAFVYPDYFEEFNGKTNLISPQNIFQNIMIGILFRHSILEKANFFREGIMFAEYDLSLRTLDTWKSIYYPKPLFVYHRGRESLTANAVRVEKGLRELERLHPDKLDMIKKIRSYRLTNSISLRRAREPDLMFYFELKNEPGILASAFDPRPIDIALHRSWFLRKLSDPDAYLFVIESGGERVGQMRLDVTDDTAEIHISIHPNHRGKGYAVFAIKEACARVFQEKPALKKIFAHIKKDNIFSQKSFAKAGFKYSGKALYKGHECIEMILKT